MASRRAAPTAAPPADPPAGPIPRWPGAVVEVPDGHPLFVRRAPSDGEPAVFVHGLGGSATNWTDLMGLLGDGLDSHAPDLPGFGDSPPPRDRAYPLDLHVRAIARYIEHLHAGPVHVLGNSLGGAVTTRLAAEHPRLVRTLTLISPGLPVYRPRLGTDPMLPLLFLPGTSALARRRIAKSPAEVQMGRVLGLCFADLSRVHPQRFAEAVADYERRRKYEHSQDALVGSLRGLVAGYVPGPRNLWRQARQVTAPVLLVWGREDRIVSSSIASRAAHALRARRLLVLDGVGHVAQMEVPELVADAVREHMDAAASTARS